MRACMVSRFCSPHPPPPSPSRGRREARHRVSPRPVEGEGCRGEGGSIHALRHDGRRATLIFALIVAAYAVYAGLFIRKTSVVVEPNSYIPETKRYYVLFDDAMVSMRYAHNLADGHGLVWNPGGERVEGYTNPLWVAYMALIHRIEPDQARTSLYVQVTGALLLIANLFVVRRIAWLVTGSAVAALGAALFTAFYLPLNGWSLEGTEVSVLTLIVSLTAWGGLRMLIARRFAAWPYALLGFSTLIRLDMAVPLAALTVFMACADRQGRPRHLLAGPLALAAFLIPQTAWRLWYYGEWLPNTYYLKMAGYPAVLRVWYGLQMTYDFLARITPLPFVALLFRPDRRVRWLAWLVAGQLLYSTWVGGDAWEWYGGSNRYISIAVPLLFVLLWTALAELHRWLVEGRRAPGRPTPRPATVRAGLALVALFLFVDYNATYGRAALDEWVLRKPPLLAGENIIRVQQAYLLEALTTPGASIAVTTAGIVPYFTDRAFVDLLGKNDRFIARLPMRRADTPRFMPGHMKWDYNHSIRQLKPDVVLEYWLEDVTPYLGEDYHAIWFPPASRDVFMRKDSPYILWDRIW